MSLVNTYTLNVDLKRKMTSVVPTYRQGDSAQLKFKVFDDGRSVPLSNFNRAEIYHELENGEVLRGDCDIDSEYISYIYSGAEMQFVGFIKTMLVLHSGSVESSIEPFKVYIYSSMKPENLTYIGILQEMIKETQDFSIELTQLINGFESFDYSSSQKYNFPNLVLYNGSTYIALQEVMGITPNDDKVNWRLVSLKGTVNTVNAVMPDGSGNVTLTPDNIGASSISELNSVDNRLTTQTTKNNNDLSSRGINILYPPPSQTAVTGDGVTDDTVALQNIINNNNYIIIPIPTVKYRITDEIVIPPNRTIEFVGGNHWNPLGSRDVWFFYDGVENSNKAIFRASTAACGVEPENATSNVKVKGGCLLDGNNKIGYGFYGAYTTNESSFEKITVINTTTDAIRFEKAWYASFKDLTAKSNMGNGITIGKSVWGGVNGCLIENLRGWGNGIRGDFSSSNMLTSYGVGLFLGSGCTAFNIVAESNYGAGLVYGLGVGAVLKLDTIYLEKNGIQAKDAGKTNRNWGLIVEGTSNSRACSIENLFLAQSIGNANVQSILLTGNRPASYFELKNIAFGQYISADWDNYKLTNVDAGISQYIEKSFPLAGIDGVLNSNWNTLYVRATGNDNNSGRNASNAYATIKKAIDMAKAISTITTIDCDGISVSTEILDFSDIDRLITIDGKNTAKINGTTLGTDGLVINNAKNTVQITGFNAVSRLLTSNSNNVRALNSNFGHRDSAFAGTMELRNSNVYLDTCTLNGVNAVNATKNGIRIYNTNLRLKNVTMSNYTASRFFSISEGSTINADVYNAIFDNVTWVDATGYIVGGNKMKNSIGSLTFE